MTTSYFTFGQCHAHSVGGITVDKDTVIKITAEDPRSVMFSLFDRKWAMEYDHKPNMVHFPNGILVIDEHGNVVL